MNHSISLIICFLSALLAFPPTVSSDSESDALNIISRSEKQNKSESEHTTYRTELVDAEGKIQQTRVMDAYYKRTDEREVTLQKFVSPPVIEDTGMMIVDTGDAVNDIWMYLPATRRLRRLSGAEKSNWFMGTEFTYEDFEDYQKKYYDFTWLQENQCQKNKTCDLIEAKPATEQERDASGYSKKLYWIERQSLYPIKVEYFDKQDAKVKTLSVEGLRQTGSYWRPSELVMENHINNRKTRMVVIDQSIDTNFDDFYVTKRYLRRE